MCIMYKTGSFSNLTLVGRVKDVQPKTANDGTQLNRIVVVTAQAYSKDGVEKRAETTTVLFAPAVVEVGDEIAVNADLSLSPMKSEGKYPVYQIVLRNSKVTVLGKERGEGFLGVNSAEIIGRVGKTREILNGKGVAVSIAMSYTTSKESKEAQTDWHSVVFWGKTAETVKKFTGKGDLLRVSGRVGLIRQKVDGVEKLVLSFIAEDYKILERKKTEANDSASADFSSGSMDLDDIEVPDI